MLVKLTSSLIILYQKVLSPFLPPACRFYPSCSEYALLALKEYGLGKGLILAIFRILRCQPFSIGGIDFPERMAKKIWKTQKG
ncbi:MAG: membrane protein insertion efficiency factor YidD [candidate division WOR-3 bacterium]